MGPLGARVVAAINTQEAFDICSLKPRLRPLSKPKITARAPMSTVAGSGIRGVDSNLVIKIGANLFNEIETKEIATACPLCVFNFRYVNYKNQMDKESKYITDYVLEAIEKD